MKILVNDREYIQADDYIYKDGLIYVPKQESTVPKNTLADAFEPYIGTKEYDGIVAVIQEWFYGTILRSAWCATAISYFADFMGILDQIGGKNENVYMMMQSCKNAKKGTFFDKGNIPVEVRRGDIIFILYDGDKMTTTSRKHATICHETTTDPKVKCIGGNQTDSICVSIYNKQLIYGIYRPNY